MDVPRRFQLHRLKDVSGVSGVGIVAYGVQFNDLTAVVHWCGRRSTTAVWNNVQDLMDVHGHEGSTILEWIDEDDSDGADPIEKPGAERKIIRETRCFQ